MLREERENLSARSKQSKISCNKCAITGHEEQIGSGEEGNDGQTVCERAIGLIWISSDCWLTKRISSWLEKDFKVPIGRKEEDEVKEEELARRQLTRRAHGVKINSWRATGVWRGGEGIQEKITRY